MRDIIQKLKQIEESQTESAGPQVGDEFGLSFSENLEISTTITDVLEDGIVVDMDDEALAHVQENGAFLYDGEVFEQEIEEGERHGNDSMYDKCRKGWRKKPGATRGSKGSCIKDDIQTEAVSIDKPADRDNPWYKLALLLSEEGEKIPLKTDEGIKLSDDVLKLAGMMNQDQIQSQKGMVAFIKQSSDPKALGEIVNKTIREFKAGREMDRTRVKEPADSDAYQGMEGVQTENDLANVPLDDYLKRFEVGDTVIPKEEGPDQAPGKCIKVKGDKCMVKFADGSTKVFSHDELEPTDAKNLPNMKNEDDMERGMGALDKFRELHRKGIGSNDDEVVLKELIEVINDDALFADEFPELKAFTSASEFDDSEIVTAKDVPGDTADEKIESLVKAIGDDSWVDDFAQGLMKDFNMGENAELDRIKELSGLKTEGHGPEIDAFFEKVAAADDGAYDMLQDAVSGKYGEQIMNACTDMYSDIASDNGYHHDDDFEKIYDRMIDNIQDDYGKKESTVDEAEYQGRKVSLGKPTSGDVKKFKVYVKNPKGNVVKVNFGDPNMRIKKSNPARRKSFRARHNCASPGPRHKARYWSCRKW